MFDVHLRPTAGYGTCNTCIPTVTGSKIAFKPISNPQKNESSLSKSKKEDNAASLNPLTDSNLHLKIPAHDAIDRQNYGLNSNPKNKNFDEYNSSEDEEVEMEIERDRVQKGRGGMKYDEKNAIDNLTKSNFEFDLLLDLLNQELLALDENSRAQETDERINNVKLLEKQKIFNQIEVFAEKRENEKKCAANSN